MDLYELVEEMLTARISPISAPTEAQYYDAWVERDVNSSDPLVTAALGGALADRLAWVFLSGYQGTIRRCFPDLPAERGWSAFVNTEDRSGTLRGTSLTGDPGQRRLSGWKTWVAASDHVDRLLVSTRENQTPFCVVARDNTGVQIQTGPQREFLPELTQGRVEFQGVAISHDQLAGDDRTFPVFRSTESVYVRAALLGFICSHATRLAAPPELIGDAVAALFGMEAILRLSLPSDTAAIAMLGADRACQRIASDFEAFIETQDTSLHARWIRDVRLVHGASAGIRTRASDALAGLQT